MLWSCAGGIIDGLYPSGHLWLNSVGRHLSAVLLLSLVWAYSLHLSIIFHSVQYVLDVLV